MLISCGKDFASGLKILTLKYVLQILDSQRPLAWISRRDSSSVHVYCDRRINLLMPGVLALLRHNSKRLYDLLKFYLVISRLAVTSFSTMQGMGNSESFSTETFWGFVLGLPAVPQCESVTTWSGWSCIALGARQWASSMLLFWNLEGQCIVDFRLARLLEG